ncbi:hypothetical protein Ddye_028150 [Dipteronia dyeriana]|uniref:Uncharacterized protein n=1 Tax=Dipteronia dyeriana TaxID=168575 RepID=A0AAD9TQF0_9ROSI|nr:hypothetical protein Ddye_028150 [Dipteronia dyeriana]
MKKVLAALFVLVILVSLQLDQAYARRFMLGVKTEKTDAKPNNQSGNSGTCHNPKTSTEPSTVVADDDNVTNSTGNSSDDVNSSYGSYGNPSGSSTETHHTYTNDCQPNKKPC